MMLTPFTIQSLRTLGELGFYPTAVHPALLKKEWTDEDGNHCTCLVNSTALRDMAKRINDDLLAAADVLHERSKIITEKI